MVSKGGRQPEPTAHGGGTSPLSCSSHALALPWQTLEGSVPGWHLPKEQPGRSWDTFYSAGYTSCVPPKAWKSSTWISALVSLCHCHPVGRGSPLSALGWNWGQQVPAGRICCPVSPYAAESLWGNMGDGGAAPHAVPRRCPRASPPAPRGGTPRSSRRSQCCSQR